MIGVPFSWRLVVAVLWYELLELVAGVAAYCGARDALRRRGGR